MTQLIGLMLRIACLIIFIGLLVRSPVEQFIELDFAHSFSVNIRRLNGYEYIGNMYLARIRYTPRPRSIYVADDNGQKKKKEK